MDDVCLATSRRTPTSEEEPSAKQPGSILSPMQSCEHAFKDEQRPGQLQGPLGHSIYEDRLYFLFCKELPEPRDDAAYMTTDNVFSYYPFCDVSLSQFSPHTVVSLSFRLALALSFVDC